MYIYIYTQYFLTIKKNEKHTSIGKQIEKKQLYLKKPKSVLSKS